MNVEEIDVKIEELRQREASLWCRVPPRAIALQLLGIHLDEDTLQIVAEAQLLRSEIEHLERTRIRKTHARWLMVSKPALLKSSRCGHIILSSHRVESYT